MSMSRRSNRSEQETLLHFVSLRLGHFGHCAARPIKSPRTHGEGDENTMTSIRSGGSIPKLLSTALGLVVVSTLAACSSSDEKEPIARGQEAVTTRNCASCHTPSDMGNATLAGNTSAFCADGKA